MEAHDSFDKRHHLIDVCVYIQQKPPTQTFIVLSRRTILPKEHELKQTAIY